MQLGSGPRDQQRCRDPKTALIDARFGSLMQTTRVDPAEIEQRTEHHDHLLHILNFKRAPDSILFSFFVCFLFLFCYFFLFIYFFVSYIIFIFESRAHKLLILSFIVDSHSWAIHRAAIRFFVPCARMRYEGDGFKPA